MDFSTSISPGKHACIVFSFGPGLHPLPDGQNIFIAFLCQDYTIWSSLQHDNNKTIMIFRHSAYIGQKSLNRYFVKSFYMPLNATVKDISLGEYNYKKTPTKYHMPWKNYWGANPTSKKTLWEKENIVSVLIFQNECLIKLVFTYHIQMCNCLKPNRIPSET